jgi:hypothetical protein
MKTITSIKKEENTTKPKTKCKDKHLNKGKRRKSKRIDKDKHENDKIHQRRKTNKK